MKRVAGIVLILGVICFGVGVTRPVIIDYFSAGNSAVQRQLVQENPDHWQFANTMMDIGVIIIPIGVAVFAFALRQRTKEIKSVLLAVVSAISVSLAVIIWMSDYWKFPRFTVLMTLGIVMLGYIIISQYSKWGGILTIVVELATVILVYITIQDVPPGAHFLPLLIAGISLLIFGGAGNIQHSASVTSDVQFDQRN